MPRDSRWKFRKDPVFPGPDPKQLVFLEAEGGVEPPPNILQTFALPPMLLGLASRLTGSRT